MKTAHEVISDIWREEDSASKIRSYRKARKYLLFKNKQKRPSKIALKIEWENFPLN